MSGGFWLLVALMWTAVFSAWLCLSPVMDAARSVRGRACVRVFSNRYLLLSVAMLLVWIGLVVASEARIESVLLSGRHLPMPLRTVVGTGITISGAVLHAYAARHVHPWRWLVMLTGLVMLAVAAL